jgi:hypothetical protein
VPLRLCCVGDLLMHVKQWSQEAGWRMPIAGRLRAISLKLPLSAKMRNATPGQRPPKAAHD